MSKLGALPGDQRKAFGQAVNGLKARVSEALEGRKAELDRGALTARLASESADVTLPVRIGPLQDGRIHPVSQVFDEVVEIFGDMGFAVAEGPDIETDDYNFTKLNIPPEHPARQEHDTFYMRGSGEAGPNAAIKVLRTHTSPVQIRTMMSQKPPIRIIVPGRVYRRDNLDLSHTPMFQQFEGLVVGENITLADLKGTLEAMMHGLFGDVKIRLRPSFFPYTEPSAEVDVSCRACGGSGCGTCKQTGWLEILGSGMVHPAVFEAVGYDPDKVTGFAFGLGMERVAMLKYGVDDIRLFYENDLRFLEQFPI
jgi:phenylalanyl-tRNA synthetase alpha chain